MVGRGKQIKPIKSIRTDDGKYKYSEEQKSARNAKDRARRLKLKIKGLEDANNELKKVNSVLSKAVVKQEKKVAQAKKDTAGRKSKKSDPKASQEAIIFADGVANSDETVSSKGTQSVAKTKKQPKVRNLIQQ